MNVLRVKKKNDRRHTRYSSRRKLITNEFLEGFQNTHLEKSENELQEVCQKKYLKESQMNCLCNLRKTSLKIPENFFGRILK